VAYLKRVRGVRTGPCIAGHPVPEHWELLLGGLAREIVKRLGAKDVEDAARQIFHYPALLHTAVCSPQIFVEGEYSVEWARLCAAGETPMGAGVRFPEARVDVRIPLDIYLGPCALWSLRTDAVAANWRKNAPDLYPAYVKWNGRHPHAYFRDVFPTHAFEAADKLGLVGLANARCLRRGRRCTAVAAWVYWIRHRRMPQIDQQLSRLPTFDLV
jgi:hypothetical protein